MKEAPNDNQSYDNKNGGSEYPFYTSMGLDDTLQSLGVDFMLVRGRVGLVGLMNLILLDLCMLVKISVLKIYFLEIFILVFAHLGYDSESSLIAVSEEVDGL